MLLDNNERSNEPVRGRSPDKLSERSSKKNNSRRNKK
jgi:hypothetical protein